MSLEYIAASISKRYDRVRTGLAAGFSGASTLDALKAVRGGVWEASAASGDMPYESGQFDVVVMEGSGVTRDSVREAHRLLKPAGCLYFTVPERNDEGDGGFSAPEIYKIVREGFDIVELKRPSWWSFWRSDRTMTVCARKKNWREHRGLSSAPAASLGLFRSSI